MQSIQLIRRRMKIDVEKVKQLRMIRLNLFFFSDDLSILDDPSRWNPIQIESSESCYFAMNF